MPTASVFVNNRTQAVRLPAETRFPESVRYASPRACLRALGAVGLMNTGETVAALAMADDHNLTVHTYNEALARKIFAGLPGHAALMAAMLERMGQLHRRGLVNPVKRAVAPAWTEF